MASELLRQLETALRGKKRALIVPHNDPDPDAVASAAALKYLLNNAYNMKATIAYEGIIGRAENKALVAYLNTPMEKFQQSHLVADPEAAYLLVDSQPGSGNHPYPRGWQVDVVIDHHPKRSDIEGPGMVVIQPETGACSTLVTMMLQSSNLPPNRELATGLFYGIKSDTRGLSRGVSQDDIDAYFYLQPLINMDALVDIEQAQVPAAYFRSLHTTLHSARIYGILIFAFIGEAEYPDMAAEMADLLLRLDNIAWAICINEYDANLVISVRSKYPTGQADCLVSSMAAGEGSAGGHGMLAGGQIPLNGRDPRMLADQMRIRALEHLGTPADSTGKTLVNSKQG